MKNLFILSSLLFSINLCFAQPLWISFTTANSGLPSNNVNDMTIDASGNIWFATNNGIAKFDKQNWTVYNSSNSPIPHNVCNTIAAEGDTIWIGSVFGLCRLIGTNWQVYPNIRYVMSMAFEPNGTKWFGLLSDSGFQGGLYRYDDISWMYYDTTNSILKGNWVTGLSLDSFNHLWLTTSYPAGIINFDGMNWTLFDTTDFGFQTDIISEISVAPNNDKWISTNKGVLKFDGTNWTIYDTTNSGLPDNWVRAKIIYEDQYKIIGSHGISFYNDTSWINFNNQNSGLIGNSVRDIEIDVLNNKWIAAYGSGISVYNENGVIISIPEISFKNSPSVYPNPTVNNLFIDLKENQSNIRVTIIDNMGKKVLIKNLKLPENKINVDDLPPGIYICNLLINQISYNFKFVKL
ncbi:MAG: T9SS type A sorting domain-containing protein [Nitrosopumilus sp.]|nr:T9SS type A sorting domain-containing protein [Nitrosopumilus sp.]